MSPARSGITIAEALAQVLAELDGPIPLDEFRARVLTIRSSSAKKPEQSIRTHLRDDEVGKTLVFLDPRTLIPLRIAMQGVRFRIPLSRREVERGILLVEPGFSPFRRC